MFDQALVAYLQEAAQVIRVSAPAAVADTPAWARPVTKECFAQEAARQGLEPWKLLAVMQTEHGHLGEYRLNSNGTYDIGPMQINSVHLPELSRTYGVNERVLAQLLGYDGCFNVAVGAWMLRRSTNAEAGDFWYGIGRYHSGNREKSVPYILKVHSNMQAIVGTPATQSRP